MKHFVAFEMNLNREEPVKAYVTGMYYPPLMGNMVDPPEHSDLDVATCEDECGNKLELTDDEQMDAIHTAEEILSEMAEGREDEE